MKKNLVRCTYIAGGITLLSLFAGCQKDANSLDQNRTISHAAKISSTGKIEVGATASSSVDSSVPLLAADQVAPAETPSPADTPAPADNTPASIPEGLSSTTEKSSSNSSPNISVLAEETTTTTTPNKPSTVAPKTYPTIPAFVSWKPESGSVSAASSVQLTFNKPMKLKSGATPLTVRGCTKTPTITSALNSDATQLIGTLSATGCTSTDTYTITFDSTSVTDSVGNSLPNPPLPPTPHIYKFRTFTTLVSMKESLRRHHTATALSDGTALIAGGWSGTNAVGTTNTILQTAETYSVSSNTTSYTTGKMQLPRTEHVAIRLQNNKVLLTGGYTSGSNGSILFSTYSELYDPTTKAFVKVGGSTGSSVEFIGTSHTMTILSTQKKVLVAGNGLVTTLLYDEATDSFSKGPDMKVSCVGPLAASLSDGTVLFVGGTCDQRAEIYDPVQNTFTLIKNPTNGVYPVPIGAAFTDGRVFLSGYPADTQLTETYPTSGIVVNDLNQKTLTCGTGNPGTSEIFDLTNQNFTKILSYGDLGKAFLLPDGMITLFAPWSCSNAAIYDPNKNQILSLTATGTIRYDYTTTLLSDGSVLRSGGYLAPAPGTSYLISTNTVDVYK